MSFSDPWMALSCGFCLLTLMKFCRSGSPKELLEAKGQFYDMLHHSGEFDELVELIG